jgi:hypothetical protein
LEKHGLGKGEFDLAEAKITEFRKTGDLPLDICAEDASRETVGPERLDNNDIAEEVESWIDYLRNTAHESYTPISFWHDLDVYVEVGVEKIDLKNLFEPVSSEFHIALRRFEVGATSMPASR